MTIDNVHRTASSSSRVRQSIDDVHGNVFPALICVFLHKIVPVVRNGGRNLKGICILGQLGGC